MVDVLIESVLLLLLFELLQVSEIGLELCLCRDGCHLLISHVLLVYIDAPLDPFLVLPELLLDF